ncbi:alpha/beta hydrolase family protein [Deinococcus peraridilitoris]|nr:alpha/beta hydrolase [Deinococcus peraridilitoris]
MLLTTAAAQGSGPGERRIAHPLGDAYLLQPERCNPSCPLLIVSHSRGMSASESMTRPHLQRMFERFTRAGFAVLVSNDAGARSWGQPASLMYLSQIRERAIRKFLFNGNTYTFGYSMGGLPATLSAFRRVFPVMGVVLLDARVNLLDAWQGSDPGRRHEIAEAYGVPVSGALPFGADPYHDYHAPEYHALPVFVAGSPDDRTVVFAQNGEALFLRSSTPDSQLLRLKGPHLGGSHFDDEVTSSMVTFLERLEQNGARTQPPFEAVRAAPNVRR